MPAERASVLGIPVDLVTTDELHARVEESLDRRVPLHIATVNAEFVMRAQQDGQFQSVLERVDLATADGAGILWALRRQGIRLSARVGGSDLVWSLSDLCARKGARLFLLGGRPGIAEAAAAGLRQRFPSLDISGVLSGSPSLDAEMEIVDSVRRSRADVLFVAFGAPQQEIWLARNLKSTGALVGMGVGGSLDYLAGAATRAPGWMQRHSLEWLWRLIREPWRWRRMLVLPRFVWRIWREKPTPAERTRA